MRRLRRALVVSVLSVAGLVLIPSAPASAHPLGNFTVNLYSGVTVLPGHVRVFHVLDMAEIPTFQEMPNIDTNGDGTASAAEKAAWAAREAPVFAGGLTIEVDGRRVPLSVRSSSMRFRPGQAGLPIIRMEATFQSRIPLAGRMTIEEHSYSDRIGWREITAVGAEGAVVTGSRVPTRSVSDALLSYPKALLSSPLRVSSAAFSFHPGPSGAAPTYGGGAVEGPRPGIAGGSFAALVTRRLSVTVFALSMLLAMGFGALHALAPGHAKTITAAYLVGANGKVRQAMVGGAAISAMHTASVLAVGLLILSAEQLFPPERVYPYLGLLSGLVVLGLGSFLLRSRLRARRAADAEHHHDHGGDRDHDHVHGHRHPVLDPASSLLSRRSLAALAISGGALPSPTALVVLLAAVALHRLAFGLALIVAFSLGLAGALTAVGVVAIRARDALARRMNAGFGRLVPVGSAAVIMGVGTYLLARAAIQL